MQIVEVGQMQRCILWPGWQDVPATETASRTDGSQLARVGLALSFLGAVIIAGHGQVIACHGLLGQFAVEAVELIQAGCK